MLVSIVVSLYNEQEGIKYFGKDLINHLSKIDEDFEVVWVNDGSLDETKFIVQDRLLSISKSNIKQKLISFSKNYGHEAAMIAGIDYAKGDAIICIDGDGQHPIEKIEEMILAHKNGAKIVLTERLSRIDASKTKKLFSGLFYKFLNSVSEIKFQKNSTDFFLISSKVAIIMRDYYRERSRFIRGFIQSVGFSKAVVYFDAKDREFGKSNYNYKGLFKLAIDAVFTFSNKPLRLSFLISISFIVFTLLFGIYSLYQFFYGETPPPGYTSIILLILIAFSLLFSIISILSLYFEKALEELRQRPIYVVESIVEG